jgi:hypothetical protein
MSRAENTALMGTDSNRSIIVASAALLSIPVILFSVMGYDINPAFLLAPLIAWAMVQQRDRIVALFGIAAVLGTLSILVANHIAPDQEMVRHFLSLILILLAPSFVFLGRFLSKYKHITDFNFWLSAFSSLFILAIALRVVLLGQEVRIYVGPEGLANMNAEFFGLPVFAAFGVLSLADLICIQATILCGSILSRSTPNIPRWIFIISLFFACFLVIGSNSRSAQMLIAWTLISVVLAFFKTDSSRRYVVLTLIAIVAGGCFTFARGMTENRMLTSLQGVSQIPVEATPTHPTSQPENSQPAPHLTDHSNAPPAISNTIQTPPETANEQPEEIVKIAKAADAFATGRVELAIQGIKDVRHSPFIGNGFSNYSKYSSEGLNSIIAANSSTHIYYLTLIWKGGLIFFIPFMLMLGLLFNNAWRNSKATLRTPDTWFTWSAVLMTFGPMAFAWDILIVPSAGALAFCLLGVLSAQRARSN